MIKEETTRQLKVGRLIQKELSLIFQKEAAHLAVGAIMTVTKARVSPDLSYARVYLSVFPSNKGEAIVAKVTVAQKQLRMYLGKRVKTQLRIVPGLSFFLDDSQEYYENIDNLLKQD